jgi:hypothetical protein
MTDEATARLERLLTELLQKTEASELDWEGSPDHQMFFYGVPGATIRVYPRDMDSVHPYLLEVLNADGVVVGRLVSEADEDEHEDPPWRDDLERLWALARDRALRISETIDLLLDSLDSRDE